MGEVLIRTHTTGPDPLGQDGDIVVACSERRIKCVHAEHICHFKNFGFNPNGLRPYSLTQQFLERTREFKFERVTPAEVLKTPLRSGSQPYIVGWRPNKQGEAMDVRQYVARRLNHPQHLMFGTPGHEVWYGGRTFVEDADLNLVWQDIFEALSLREEDHRQWPWSDIEKSHFLALKTDFLNDVEAEEFIQPEREQSGTDELGNPVYHIIQKRKNYIHWQGLPLLGHSEQNVKDQTKIIEARSRAYNKNQVIRQKGPRGNRN